MCACVVYVGAVGGGDYVGDDGGLTVGDADGIDWWLALWWVVLLLLMVVLVSRCGVGAPGALLSCCSQLTVLTGLRSCSLYMCVTVFLRERYLAGDERTGPGRRCWSTLVLF